MDQKIDSMLEENRTFSPSSAFRKQANLSSFDEYKRMWNAARDEPEVFWSEQAQERLTWQSHWKKTLEWQPPHACWFDGGKINAAVNCLDRHLGEHAQKEALVWEGEPGDKRALSYAELHGEVCKLANLLNSWGLIAGDRVTIYLPLVPELAISVLACARLGLIHNVVFAGFSAGALADRNHDAKPRLVITADGGFRKNTKLPLKEVVDEALIDDSSVERVLVLKRTGQKVAWKSGRDFWWHEQVEHQHDCHRAEGFDSEHPLFLLYTSGSTGKPKGILHTTAGYLLGANLSYYYIFDHKPDDLFWCTADIGWITGHSYVIYGPLSNGARIFMYEGAPFCPDPGRFWQMIEEYKISVLYTAPTAIRAFMKEGESWINRHDLSSLRLLGTVGEPINPEAWMWYHKVIGAENCPIVDTWWQTETGSIMISALPGLTDTKPGSATLPFFGVVPEIVDAKGEAVEDGRGGFLTIKQAWPSMLRTIYRDSERYAKTYFDKFGDRYFTGDGARVDQDGYFWILGRIDDVLNVSGHRLSTMEIESSLVATDTVVEAAVVGIPHSIKGEAILCFVVTSSRHTADESLKSFLCQTICRDIGNLARPEAIVFVDALPKTRSGKIMRRLLKEIAKGENRTGDTSTLEDQSLLASIAQQTLNSLVTLS